MPLITPEYLQTKTYSALRDRLMFQHGGAVQPGVWDPTDLKVVQRAAGANLSVDVGAGFALVAANDTGNAGFYHAQNDAATNVVGVASHATLPRIDQLILRVNDTTHGGDLSDAAVFEVLTGTATSGATLDNRTGAAALPTGSLRLADILVPAVSSTITTANIRDRRPWARGARYEFYQAGNLALTASTVSYFSTRLEFSGNAVFTTLSSWQVVSTLVMEGRLVANSVSISPEAAWSASVSNVGYSGTLLTGSNVVALSANGRDLGAGAAAATVNQIRFSIAEVITPSGTNN